MNDIEKAGIFELGHRTVKRVDTAPCSWPGRASSGRPRIATPRSRCGVDHIDTSDFYGPYVVNQLIKEALHPYPRELVLVTKVGARRGSDAEWLPAFSPEELVSAVHSP